MWTALLMLSFHACLQGLPSDAGGTARLPPASQQLAGVEREEGKEHKAEGAGHPAWSGQAGELLPTSGSSQTLLAEKAPGGCAAGTDLGLSLGAHQPRTPIE